MKLRCKLFGHKKDPIPGLFGRVKCKRCGRTIVFSSVRKSQRSDI